MPTVPADCRARSLRLAAIGILVVGGLIRAPDPAGQAVERMVLEAEDLAHFEAFIPARTKLYAALRHARQLGDAGLIALCLDRIGLVLEFEGRNADGTEHHERAVALARKIGDRQLAASILASIGIGHWRRADYAAALDSLREALAIQEELRDVAGQARTLDFIGRVYFKQAEYADAQKAYHRAVGMLEAAGDRRWLSITLEDVGDLALEQGFFVEALDAFERALAARTQLRDVAGEVYMLTVIGRGYLQQAAYREAVAWFQRAVLLSRQSGNRAGLAYALYHMGLAHERLINPAEALAFHAEALAVKEELGDRRGQGWILGAMGDAHALDGDLHSALEAYDRATRIWEEIRDPRGTAAGLSKAARVNFELGRYEESAGLFRRASELLDISHPAFLANALVGMGKAYAATGNELRAMAYARQAEEIARRGSDVVRWTTLRSLAWIERRLGRRDDALVHYRESLAVIEQLRGRVAVSADVRADFLEGKQAVYGATVELLIELDHVEEALEVAERSRARAFLDQLAARSLVTRPVDPAALARIASLDEVVRSEAGQARTGAPALLTRADRGDPLPSQMAASAVLRPELTRLITTPAVTLTQARIEGRRRGGTILEYFSGADRLFIWVLAPDGTIRGASARIGRDGLSELVRAVRASLGADGTSEASLGAFRQASSDSRLLLRRLYQLLIEPVESFLPRNRNSVITVVPHGPLFLLSFAALVDGEGQYVVERHTLAYSPSISVLPYIARRRDRVVDFASPRLLVIGNPAMPEPRDTQQPLGALPGAESEAIAVARLYPPRYVTALVGSRARERTARELAPGQTIIHLATHAVIFDDEPMDSYLALTPDTKPAAGARDPLGDGFLTVAEIFGLGLDADLVTLSACNTGLGRVSGEGVVGLSRAFIYSGTASVLVSLWPVADGVAAIQMERFYRELIRTSGDKAAALAAAQREMIGLLRQGTSRSPSGRAFAENPLLWAPFVLVGEAH